MNTKLFACLVYVTCALCIEAAAQNITHWGPDGFVKIEEGSGGFFATLDPGDRFSRDHDQAGDINGDGIIDLVVGARSDDDGATDAGAVYILFMNSDGTVQSNQKISALDGGFTDNLMQNNFFGYGVAGIGDYDDDGIPDIAVSAPASSNRALYILHLNGDGTVKNFVKTPNVTAQGLSAVGDLNDDGRIDLVACDPGSDIGGNNIGAISLLFFDSNSEVIPGQTVLINPQSGGLGAGLIAGDEFGGREVAMLGDIDGDGTKELAVGAFKSDGGKGAIWMLSLDETTFNVVSKLKITEGLNGFTDTLTLGSNPNGSQGANFGHALCRIGDLNGDGVPDLMTGANQQNEGWGYILYLNADKTVKTYQRLNNDDGGFEFSFTPEERFSRSVSFLGDLRGDGTLAVNYGGGAGGAGTQGATGALYVMFLEPCSFSQVAGFNHWSGGNTLYSNWTHATQTVSEPLTWEQCTFKAFETDAPNITYNNNDGRCICMDNNAALSISGELSTAFTNLCSSSITLPITLQTPLTSELQSRSVRLLWTTAREVNNAGFNLQKSRDGSQWTDAVWLDGQGTSDYDHTYTWVDNNPYDGLSFYRFKQVDLDGHSTYSNITTAIYSTKDVLAYPNPASDLLHFKGLGERELEEVILLDLKGQVVASLNSRGTTVDLSNVSSGIYLLKMTIDNVNEYQKIIVQ